MSELSSPGAADRAASVVLGAAIGDALGYPVEFSSLRSIRERFGPAGVTGYVEYSVEGGRRFAAYSDDTQLAVIVLEALLQGRERGSALDACMHDLARRFMQWAVAPLGGHRRPGNACLAGCQALAAGRHWSEAGAETAGGCGSVMRVYPVALLHADDPERAEAWAVAQSKLTHRAPLAFAACAAFVRCLLVLLENRPVEAACVALLESAARYDVETARRIEAALSAAAKSEPPDVVLQRYLGWAAHDAVAAASYVLVRHPTDPRAALLEAVNSPGDSDSIGTLVGALVGACNELTRFPADWVDGVERSAELCALAARTAVVLRGASPMELPPGSPR